MMGRLWHKHPFLLTSFALALGLTVFFAGRLTLRAVYWSDPAHQNQTVEGWMTAGYIGRSWGVDAAELAAAAGLPAGPVPLREIARERGVPEAQIIAAVNAVLAGK